MRHLTKLRPRLSYANLVATLALFLALGGTAWAALGKNAVKTKNIAPNAVTAAKIKQGAVTAPKIARDAVTVNKLGRQAVTARALAPKSVLPGALALGAVQSGALATNAVTAAKIQNGNVTANKIQAKAVTTAKFADDAVAPNSKLFDGLASSKVMKTDRFGRTRVVAGTTATGATTAGIASFINNGGSVDFSCDGTMKFTLHNDTTSPMTIWTATDGAPAQTTLTPAGGTFNPDSDNAPTDDTGWISWQIQTATTLINMTTTSEKRPSDCAYSAYYVETTLGSG